MRSIKAQDRELELWFEKIKRGEIKLPRFQRFEAWDRSRIKSLLTAIVNNLPLGVTLILEVDSEKFISRYIATAEKQPPFPRVTEQLLDGQQRLTAIWRSLFNNYDDITYFIYLKEFDLVWDVHEESDEPDEDSSNGVYVYGAARWQKKNGTKMPLWADNPAECFKRGCIPFELLRPQDIANEVDDWLKKALKFKKPKPASSDFEKQYEKYSELKNRISDKINEFRGIIKNYNLPYLALPSETPRDVALNVFINMNTNSKPLSQYDIIVAEIEGVADESLHSLQEQLDQEFPPIKKYYDLSFQILYTSALIQNKVPNRSGIWDMDRQLVVANWPIMKRGLARMAEFLSSQYIYDQQRLPTNAVLAVIAALFTHIPETGDRAGSSNVLLKKYIWSAFFTDRYENSAASRAFADYVALKNLVTDAKKEDGSLFSENDVPVLNRSLYPIATEEQLFNVTWPKYETIRGRGILAVANYFGAIDFADGSTLSITNIINRQYHHVFPDALVREASNNLPAPLRSYLALNCALITDKTNLNIGKKEPLEYLKDRYEWTNETVITQRLNSHLIPVDELASGSYEGLSDNDKAIKVKTDFEKFIQKRAKLITKAVDKLVKGEIVYLNDVIES